MRHERSVSWWRALWADDYHRSGAPCDVTIGVAQETAPALSAISVSKMESTNIHEVKLKMSCYNRDSDRAVGVCCHDAFGLGRTERQIPRPFGRRIRLPVSQAPSCIVKTNPSRTVLNPLNTTMTLARFHTGRHIAVLTKDGSIEYIIWKVHLPLYGNCELSASMHSTPTQKAHDAL